MDLKNIILMILSYSIAVQADPQIKKLERILSQDGVVIDNIRINDPIFSFDQKIRSKVDVLKPIKIVGIDLPSGSVLEYEDEYLSKVSSNKPIQVGEYECKSGYSIGFQSGKLCRCYLSKDISDKGVIIPKNSDLIFHQGTLTFVKTSSSWRYENKNYKKGTFNITSEKTVSPISEGLFSQDLCINMSNKSKDKAIEVLKQLKIDVSSIKILDTFDTQNLDEDYYYYNGHNIRFLIINPVLIEKETYPRGTIILLVNKVIREIELPENHTIKVQNQFVCSGKIEKHSNGKICSCEISQDTLIKGYKIKPPATLYFNTDGFEIFRNFNKQSMNRGFYKINNNGKTEFNSDVEYFHCNN